MHFDATRLLMCYDLRGYLSAKLMPACFKNRYFVTKINPFFCKGDIMQLNFEQLFEEKLGIYTVLAD